MILGQQAEVERLKSDLAAARAEIEEHRARFARATGTVGEYMGKATRFERELAAARADAERLRAALRTIVDFEADRDDGAPPYMQIAIKAKQVARAALAATEAVGKDGGEGRWGMSDECICGYRPPTDPSPDCERCRLITDLAVARADAERLANGIVNANDAIRGRTREGRWIALEREAKAILAAPATGQGGIPRHQPERSERDDEGEDAEACRVPD